MSGTGTLGPVGCRVWALWIRLVLAHPANARSDWDLGSLEAKSMPWALCHVPRVALEQFFSLWWDALSCWGRSLSLGSAVAIQQCLGIVVHFKATSNARTLGLSAEHCIVTKSITSAVSGLISWLIGLLSGSKSVLANMFFIKHASILQC